jgi:hypothetical protein
VSLFKSCGTPVKIVYWNYWQFPQTVAASEAAHVSQRCSCSEPVIKNGANVDNNSYCAPNNCNIPNSCNISNSCNSPNSGNSRNSRNSNLFIVKKVLKIPKEIKNYKLASGGYYGDLRAYSFSDSDVKKELNSA